MAELNSKKYTYQFTSRTVIATRACAVEFMINLVENIWYTSAIISTRRTIGAPSQRNGTIFTPVTRSALTFVKRGFWFFTNSMLAGSIKNVSSYIDNI